MFVCMSISLSFSSFWYIIKVYIKWDNLHVCTMPVVATSRDGKLNLGLNISREITKDDIWKKG